MACDADLIPIALGTQGEVLDVGRTSRLVTPAIWRALVCRDRHCAFPGCTRPPVMGHAHHIVPWADHGATSLENLVLLCGHHHRTIHHPPGRSASTQETAGPSSSHPQDPEPHHPPGSAPEGVSDPATPMSASAPGQPHQLHAQVPSTDGLRIDQPHPGA